MGLTKKNNRFITVSLIVLLVPFLSISGIKNSVGITLYQTWQSLSVLFLFILILASASKIRMNWSIVLFILYQGIILASTFFQHSFSFGILIVTLASVFLFMLLQTDYYYEIVAAICAIVILAVIINFPVMLSRLNVKDAIYFIGGKNALSMFLVPGAFLILVNSLNRHGKFSKATYVIIGLCLATVFISMSGTGIVVTTIAAGLMLLAIRFKPKKWIYILTILVLYVLFIFLAESFFSTNLWISFTDILGKDSSLTSRTTIWRLAKEIISENWLFGAGRGTEISYINSWGGWQTIYEAHNFILEMLMEGGVVAFGLYAAMYTKAMIGLDMDDKKSRVIFIAFYVLLINGLTESTLNNFFVTIVFGIACRYASEKRGKFKTYEQQIQKS